MDPALATDALEPFQFGQRVSVIIDAQVERSVYALSSEPVVMQGAQALPSKDVLLVDDLFFDVLRFPFAHGNPMTALSSRNIRARAGTESSGKKPAAVL